MDIDMPQPTVAKEPVLEVGPEFELFANDLDDCLSPLLSVAEKRDKILDLPRKYHENALKRLAKLEPRTSRSQNDDVSTDAGGELASLRESDPVRQLEREAQTWDLLRRLLPLRHQSSKTQNNRSRLENLADKPTTTNALHEFLDTNPDAKERRAVLQWLQTNAASGPEIDELTEKLQKNADRGDIIAHGWLHTRSAIKNRKRLTGWPHLLDRQSANASSSLLNESGAPLVTQLDPDACTRQGRKLQPQDEYFERAIWLGCFEHLRRGSDLQTLREWCEERTEMWRAVSLSAMLLSGDEDGVSGVVDPMALTLWRRMCFGLARQGGSDDYERAVYGVLSGDIQSVEKVASTWDDHLFAHYNALLRTQIDHFLLKECTQDVASSLTTTFPTFDAIQFHGEQGGAEKRLLKSLESQPSTKQEALLPHKALQAAVISKEVQEYLFDQGLALGPQTETMPLLFGNATISSDRSARVFKPDELDGLRIVAHVFALVSVLERLASEEQGHTNSSSIDFEPRQRTTQENIIAQYTDLLRRAKLPELVPLYCSLLDTPRLYEVLSSNLILEQQLENRLTQLKLIKRANINVVEFVQVQASMLYDRVAKDSISPKIEGSFGFHILEDGPPSTRLGRTIKADFFGEDENDVEPAHDHLIRSLEWLLLVDETWADVFAAGTRIYKYFLRNMHLRAARLLMKRVPLSEVMKDLVEEGEDSELENIDFWTEQVEQRGLDVAPEKLMAEARTFRELEKLVKTLDTLETIASLVEISAEVTPSSRNFWSNLGDLVKTVKVHMEPLLKNWLMVGVEEGDKELGDLRLIYLPETMIAYISALHVAGTSLSRDWLLECMELATFITERDTDVLALFVESKRVKELLESFAACSKALAIATEEKRATGTSSKKLRELGWSRDVWSIKS